MSTNRLVHFKWNTYTPDLAAKRAFEKAFGQPCPPINMNAENPYEVSILCRLDQFAEFLILRNDEGGRNGFKDLKPRIIESGCKTYDVSANPQPAGE